MKGTTSEMISMMEGQDGDKFKNSKFLKFLKNVHSGDYHISEGQLTKKPIAKPQA